MRNTRMSQPRSRQGFTIVELLIVVVVIAILAAITIVAYNGIQNRAKESAVMSSVSQAMKKIEAFKSGSITESYPTSATEAGIANLSDVTYFYNAARSTYCVQAKNGQIAYSATNAKTKPTTGNCSENGLIGWWQLNGNGDDSSGNGWVATVSGVSAQGQNNQAANAYDFDGSVPAIRVVGSEAILPTDNTFSLWYNVDAWNTGAATSFVAKRSGTTTGHFIMRLTSSNSLSIDCGGSNNRWTPSTPLSTGAWTHLVVVCTPTYVSAYVNGTSVGSKDQASGTLANNTILQFGQDGGGYGIDGRMDDIRLFNRALTTEEVTQLYQAGAR